MGENFFLDLSLKAKEIWDDADSGEPYYRIRNKAWNLSEFLGGQTADIFITAAYSIWWEATKLRFERYILVPLNRGRNLDQVRLEEFEKRFEFYLKSERERAGVKGRSGLALLGHGYQKESVKARVLCAYKEVLVLYSEARKASRFPGDKRMLQVKINKLDYAISLIKNKDGLADKFFENRRKRLKKKLQQIQSEQV
jgi:hypothetical protein